MQLIQRIPTESSPIKISFRNTYNDRVIEIYANHDYYITYKPQASLEFKTVSGQVVGISEAERVIKLKTSIVDELTTYISISTILSATPINTNNQQTNLDFIGVEISDVKLTMSLHLKYLSGDYTTEVTPGGLYEVTFVQSKNGNLDLVTVIGRLMNINYPYQTFSPGPHVSTQFAPVTQARNQNPNCIFTFDCSNDYSSVRIKVDLRDIRAIKDYIIIDDGDNEEPDVPPIPEGFSYMTLTTSDGTQSYVEVIDENGKPAIVFGK